MSQWLPAPGYEGRYEVSDEGQVRASSGRVLKASPCGKGYRKVCLSGVSKAIHPLVTAAFIGARPDGKVINHKDGNKANNRVSNLEYVTQLENMHHARDNGLFPPPVAHTYTRPSEETLVKMREKARMNRKLNDESIALLKSRIRAGVPDRKVAAEFGLSPGAITRVKQGKLYAS